MVLVITCIITCIIFKDLIILVTLKTLKVLNILTERKAEIAEFPPPKKINSANDKVTITASKLFILSSKYSL